MIFPQKLNGITNFLQKHTNLFNEHLEKMNKLPMKLN